MSLAHALFSSSQSKLLEWVFGQPERSFHVQELLRLTQLASASLQREIKRLHCAGLVVEERIGNLRRIHANEASPVYAELVGIVRKTMGTAPLLSQALAVFASRIHIALLFGSVAAGKEHADSDIDLLLVSDSLSISEVLTAVLPLEERLGRRIEPKLYTRAEFEARKSEAGSVVVRILAQPYDLLMGSL